MAIVFGLENPTFFLATSDISILKCTEGGSTGLGNIPKKNGLLSSFVNHVFFGAFQYHLRPAKHALDLINYQKYVSGPRASSPISKLRLTILKSKRFTKGPGGPQGHSRPGLLKVQFLFAYHPVRGPIF